MKSRRFTLVHDASKRPGAAGLTKAAGKSEASRGNSRKGASVRRKSIGDEDLEPVSRQQQAERVGLWDLGAWLARLPDIAERANAVQEIFEFYVVKATVPAGTIRRPEGMLEWYREQTGVRLGAKGRRELVNNVIADDLFALADVVRKDLALDYIVGITPSMVAGANGDEIYWNHFASGYRRTLIASTYDLRAFATTTGHAFEVYLGAVILAQILTAYNPRLVYHENRGCLFDYNASRVSLQTTIADLRIEESCLAKMLPRYRPAANALVELLRTWETAI